MSKRTHNFAKLILTLAFALCMFACIFTMNFASAATAPSIKDGASIRYDNDGIRFSAYVPDEYFTDTATHTLKDGVTVGMYVALASISGDNLTDIDASTTGVKTVNPTNWKSTSDKSKHQQYNVVIYGIPDTDYDTSIYARAFITDTNITEGEQTAYTATVVRSIREVANATLAGDVLLDSEDANKLSDTQVTTLNKYIADEAVALGDVTVKIRGGYAVWEAVENATAYIVKTESGTFKTTEPKFLLDGDSKVSVVAYGDGTTATYSNVASKTAHELGEMELATFNNVNYVEDLEAGNSSLTNYNYETSNSTHTANYSHYFYNGGGAGQVQSAPTFNAAGYVRFGVGVTNYVNTGSLSVAAFSVYLQKGLDLTNHSGIQIKLKFEKYSAEDTGEYTFKLADPEISTEKNGYYRQGGYAAPNATWLYDGAEISATADEWVTWKITSAQLSNFYSNGDYKLVFTHHTTAGFSVALLQTAYFQIDEIKYYDDVPVPTNVALSEAKVLSWDAVDGATGYEINVNGTPVQVTNTSCDLSEYLTADAEIKVRAIRNDEYSEYSGSVYFYAPSTAGFPMTFDSESYVNRVLIGDEGTIKTYSSGTKMCIPSGFTYTKEYVSSVEGAEDGALRILPVVARYGSWSTSSRLALFTIVLPEELNSDTTDGNLGISIRIKLGDIVAGGETAYSGSQASNYYLCLVANGETIADGNYRFKSSETEESNTLKNNNIPYKVINNDTTAFTTWYLDFATLLARGYDNGATEITFGILTETAVTSGSGFCIETYIDELAYYKETPV